MTIQTIRISSAQIRAARGLLDWSARELSKRSGVSQSTIHRAETADGIPNIHALSLGAIKGALERSGVEFLDECGVRLRLLNGERPKMRHALPNKELSFA